MLIAYLDESDEKQIFTMAGYVSEAAKWERFTEEWAAILSGYSVGDFHARQFAHNRGQFKDWPESRRREFITELTSAINRNVLYGVAVAVVVEEFNKIITGDLKSFLKEPYYLSADASFTLAIQYCIKHFPTEQIAFVFDNKDKVKGVVQKIYGAYKELKDKIPDPTMLGPLSFADDKKVLPLQAADMLAYEYMKYHNGWERTPLHLLSEIKGGYFVYDRQRLIKYESMFRVKA